MKMYIPLLLLLTGGAACAQEGFSPTLPWGTQSVQAGDLRNNTGFSPTMPFFKASEQPIQPSPHQDYRYCPRGFGYGYYNNYYYGPGSGYYYNNNGYTNSGPESNSGIPGYDKPLPSNTPPGY